MLDLIIRGGTVVDGTGAAPCRADVGVKDGRIAAVGLDLGPARREIDAAGHFVTPGWVDIHTHYDGQATWDPELEPSFSSGVTTVIAGNCGVGFAPVRPGMQQRLIDLMEGVEDIPGTALHVGMKWNWTTFTEYLDTLDAMPRTMDVGCLVPHGPLRLWAMGDRVGTDKCATGEDLAEMKAQLTEAMEAGAFGLASSRTPIHRTLQGEMTPDFNVDLPELVALIEVVRAHGGIFQVVPTGISGEDMAGLRNDMAMIEEIAARTGVHTHVLMFQTASEPDYYLEQLDTLERINRVAPTTAQFGGRGTGSIVGFLGMHPFMGRPTFIRMAQEHDRADWLEQLARPDVRAAILAETSLPGSRGAIYELAFDRMFDLGPDLDYEPERERSLAAMAEASGKTVEEAVYDFMLEHSVHPRLYIAYNNYCGGDLEPVRTSLGRDHVVLSASDAGAHVQSVCDGSIHSFMLTHWVRDRQRGPRIPLETVVNWLTQKAARSVGLTDRGVIAPGLKADINVFALDKLKVCPPEIRDDLPGGAYRLLAPVVGYRATVVAGVVTRENDVATGALPGRLVRYQAASMPPSTGSTTPVM